MSMSTTQSHVDVTIMLLFVQPLGVGGTGETYLCKRRDNGKEEAVKVIKRPIPLVLQNLITNEVILQASLGEGHVNIVNAHELMLTDTHLCLFMEYISGGTLTDYVSARCETADQRHGLYLDEDEARFLFQVRLAGHHLSHCGVSQAAGHTNRQAWGCCLAAAYTASSSHTHVAHISNGVLHLWF